MVARQFAEARNDDGSKGPSDPTPEAVVEGDGAQPTQDDLQLAADAMNAAAAAGGEATDHPEPGEGNEPAAPSVPEQVSVREKIAKAASRRRMGDMDGTLGDDGSVQPIPEQAPETENIDPNAQNLYYGQFGSDDVNFMGQAKPAPKPDSGAPAPQEGSGGQPQQSNSEPGADTVEVIVDGERRNVSRDELVRNYQINSAADRRLEQAQMLLAQAQQNPASGYPQQGTPDAGQPVGDQTEPGHQATQQSMEQYEPALEGIDWASAARAIQLGDEDEAVQALQSLASQVVQKNARPQDNGGISSPAQVETVAQMVEDSTMSKQAHREFMETYPEIAQDASLYAISQTHAMNAILEDFQKFGATPEQLQFAVQNPEQARDAHRHFRVSQQYPGIFRSPGEIYQQAGEKTREWITSVGGQAFQEETSGQGTALAQPQQQNPQMKVPRADRARAAQQSPNARTTPAPVANQQQPTVKSPSDVIGGMRKARQLGVQGYSR